MLSSIPKESPRLHTCSEPASQGDVALRCYACEFVRLFDAVEKRALVRAWTLLWEAQVRSGEAREQAQHTTPPLKLTAAHRATEGFTARAHQTKGISKGPGVVLREHSPKRTIRKSFAGTILAHYALRSAPRRTRKCAQLKRLQHPTGAGVDGARE